MPTIRAADSPTRLTRPATSNERLSVKSTPALASPDWVRTCHICTPPAQRLGVQRPLLRGVAKGRPTWAAAIHPESGAVLYDPEAPRQVAVCYFPWSDRIILC